jgi:hypothetical protein
MVANPGRRGSLPVAVRIALQIAVAALSIAATSFGIRELLVFDNTAGAAGTVPAGWPRASAIERPRNRPELLVFVHPYCSCTFATIDELEQLEARMHGTNAPEVDILVYRPLHSKWAPNSLWKKAQGLPQARVRWDDDAREARRFGVLTSGYTVLYSASGELLFNGGVTGSRGHMGDNFGLDRLAAALASGDRAPGKSLVFGCALGGPAV